MSPQISASPEFDSPTPPRHAFRIVNSVYDAGANTRRTVRWNAPTVSPNSGVLSMLATLRDRSRTATRNDGYAKSVIDKLVTNVIGTGVKPLSQAVDSDFRKRVQETFLAWTDQSDADGNLDFYGQQAQACRAWFEGGECFVRLRPRLPSDGLAVPLQLQVLEGELCPHDYDVSALQNGNKIRAGIEFDRLGRRVAYWFYTSTPGEFQDFNQSDLRRVPASSVIHLFDPLRPGQLRGIPILTPALVRLYELDKFDDATLLRQQLANMFVGFMTRTASDSPVALNPLTGADVVTDADDKPLMELEPGMFQQLDPGEDVKFSEPPAAPQTYPDFMRQQLRGVAAATNVPYEVLTGDMTALNDRTLRAVLLEFRRRLQMWQYHNIAFQFCRPVWTEWMDRAFFAEALPIPTRYAIEGPLPWSKVKWIPQGWPYLNPVQDIEATQKAIRAGVTSRQGAVSETGEDAEAIDAEQKADNDRADSLGLRYDSDARYALTANGNKDTKGAEVQPADQATAEGANA